MFLRLNNLFVFCFVWYIIHAYSGYKSSFISHKIKIFSSYVNLLYWKFSGWTITSFGPSSGCSITRATTRWGSIFDDSVVFVYWNLYFNGCISLKSFWRRRRRSLFSIFKLMTHIDGIWLWVFHTTTMNKMKINFNIFPIFFILMRCFLINRATNWIYFYKICSLNQNLMIF